MSRLASSLRSWDPSVRLILFGSRARGDELVDSDYDLIVISERFSGIPFPRRAVEVWRVLLRSGVLGDFEFLCYTPREFERKAREIGVVSLAAREGVKVDPRRRGGTGIDRAAGP